MFYRIIIIILLMPAVALCGNYNFEWVDNPEPDIAKYRMYWRVPIAGEVWECTYEAPHKYCTGPTDGFSDAEREHPNTPQWWADTNGRVTTMTVPAPDDSMCYSVTAFDTGDFESSYSNQVCVRKIRWAIRR